MHIPTAIDRIGRRGSRVTAMGICIRQMSTLRKASIVQTAQRMLTDRTTAQAMMPAQKRSRTIQIRDRNMPAASPAVKVAGYHKVV